MHPIAWLCANLDAVNQRTSRPAFKLLNIYTDRLEVMHLDTGEIWKFQVSVAEDVRLQPKKFADRHAKPMCSCINGCKAAGCTNV